MPFTKRRPTLPITRRALFAACALACVVPLDEAEAEGEVSRWSRLKAEIRRRHPRARQLSVPELQTWLADASRPAPLLIDTREAAEYADGRLPGALHAQSPAAAMALLQRHPQATEVVLYCSVGYRSAQLAERLQALLQARPQGGKVPEVFNLEGSIFEWAERGLPMINASGPTRLVHPYDERWGRYVTRALWSRMP